MSDVPARRERRVLELLYERGDSSASEIQEALDDGSSYSAVRGMLRVMESKGLVAHQSVRGKYVYSPLRSKGAAAKEALGKLVKTFFDGKVEDMVLTLLSDDERSLSPEELQKLIKAVEDEKRSKK